MHRASIGTDEDWLNDRIARLSGKAAIISVGAPTNAELKEIRHRVDDSLQATRAAMAEGIVAGGGAALLHAEPALDKLEVTGDYEIGVEIVRRALTEPVHLIATNAGYDGADVVKQVTDLGVDEGFDALEGRFGNMVEMGIIDPLRVVRSALQNGASVGRADPHHQLAGGRGADAVEQVADDRVRPARRGHPAAVAGLQHPAVAGPGPAGRARGVVFTVGGEHLPGGRRPGAHLGRQPAQPGDPRR